MDGPKILYIIPIFGGIKITSTTVLCWAITALVSVVCIYLGHDLKTHPETKRQLIAEKLVEMLNNMVDDSMGEHFRSFAPYIGALFSFSILGSLSSLLGLRSTTADFSVTLGMALATVFLIHYVGIKYQGLWGDVQQTFLDPPFLLPLNVVSEIARPISLSFRHFGNIASGSIITSLIYTSLAAASSAIFNIGIPFLQVGLPAFLSLYFDLFTGYMQAYIFCMLTMVFVSSAAGEVPEPKKQ